MTLRAGESRSKKCLHQLPDEGVTDHEAAKTDQVQIVILNAWLRRKVFMKQTGAYPRLFICVARCPDSASTHAYAAIRRPSGNRAGQWHDKIMTIIVLFRPAIAKGNHFMTDFAQFPSWIFFQLVTPVISRDVDAFRFRQDGQSVRHISLRAKTTVANP